jgi:UDPglucose 6-dehydrogenase
MARITVFGLWHLGSVVAACLAALGHHVRGVDFDAATVTGLAVGRAPVFEPGLDELLARQIGSESLHSRATSGRLTFTTNPREALSDAEAVFVTFDTPVDANDEADLTPIDRAMAEIAALARQPLTIVVMSQVPVGTCRRMASRLRQHSQTEQFTLLCQPENLRLGQAIETFLRPDRVVVGAEDRAAAAKLEPLYLGIPGERLIMSWESAELAKHATNAFLATSVSFANELAGLAEVVGADIRDVVGVLRADRRIGPMAFLSPGPGFAGGTLGRDVQALRRLGRCAGRPTRVLDAALAVNQSRLSELLVKLTWLAGGALCGKRVALLGLVYKPGTSTLRRSHAVEFARQLAEAGAIVRAFDPKAEATAVTEATSGVVTFCADACEAVAGADAVVLMTPWPEFRTLDWGRIRSAMRRAAVLDAHNVLDESALRQAGFAYAGVGISRIETEPAVAGTGARL